MFIYMFLCLCILPDPTIPSALLLVLSVAIAEVASMAEGLLQILKSIYA